MRVQSKGANRSACACRNRVGRCRDNGKDAPPRFRPQVRRSIVGQRTSCNSVCAARGRRCRTDGHEGDGVDPAVAGGEVAAPTIRVGCEHRIVGVISAEQENAHQRFVAGRGLRRGLAHRCKLETEGGGGGSHAAKRGCTAEYLATGGGRHWLVGHARPPQR